MPRLDTSEACRDRSLCDAALLLVKCVPLCSIHDIAMLSLVHTKNLDLSLCCATVCPSRRRCDLQPILSRHLSLPLILLINRAVCVRGSRTDTYAPVWLHISRVLGFSLSRLLQSLKRLHNHFLTPYLVNNVCKRSYFPTGLPKASYSCSEILKHQ